MSDTPEPAPLTEREMNQFITLAALPTLERALARLRWLEAENAQRTAERDSTNAHFLDAWRERADFARELERELAAAKAEVAKANAERDEARRDLCMSEAIDRLHDAHPHAPISRCASIRIANEIASERGWDCFKEVTP